MEESIETATPYRKHPIRIEGHRGAGYLANENTIEAFIKAVELGLDGVELDVR
jgi:Glycerophosphoryl diester phosphodiesterase